MNGPLQKQIGKMELIKKGSANHLITKKVATIPHFVMDISVDGVKIANNTKIPSATPVVGRLHSVQPSASNDRGIVRFERPEPFIIGFLHATKQSNASFLEHTIKELLRLSPLNNDKEVISGRSCTVKLLCVIADNPMRSFLKRTILHTGQWSFDCCIQRRVTKGSLRLNDVNVPLRIDSQFLTYCKSDNSEDNHIPNPADKSPTLHQNCFASV